jgi:hypothetical protein
MPVLLLRDGGAVWIPAASASNMVLADSFEVTTPCCYAQLVEMHCLPLLQGHGDLGQQEATSFLHTIVTFLTLYFGLNPATDVS